MGNIYPKCPRCKKRRKMTYAKSIVQYMYFLGYKGELRLCFYPSLCNKCEDELLKIATDSLYGK